MRGCAGGIPCRTARGLMMEQVQRRTLAEPFELPERGGCHQPDQQPEDGEHNEKLEQREAVLLRARILGEADRITPLQSG